MRNIVALVIFVVLAYLLCVPSVPSPRSRRYALRVKQNKQLYSIDAAVESFSKEFNGYPPSGAADDANRAYGGAMKLTEAVIGRDLLGFHPLSRFRQDGRDPNGGRFLYESENMAERKGPYLQAENACAYRLVDIYGKGHTGAFPEDAYVLCDVYSKARPSGAKTGMPILYYRANTKATAHDVSDPNNPANIYNYRDNQALVELGVPGDSKAVHPLADPKRFYLNTENDKPNMLGKPRRADSYILLSAGHDGLYGTADDICNFEWKYRGQ